MKKHIKYFIAAYLPDRVLWWDDDFKRWVPAGLCLYRSTWDSLDDVFRIVRKVKKSCSGWHDDIYIDTYVAYTEI